MALRMAWGSTLPVLMRYVARPCRSVKSPPRPRCPSVSVPGTRRRLSTHGLLSVAVVHDDSRRSLYEQHFPADGRRQTVLSAVLLLSNDLGPHH
jgi:hypothetical protein